MTESYAGTPVEEAGSPAPLSPEERAAIDAEVDRRLAEDEGTPPVAPPEVAPPAPSFNGGRGPVVEGRGPVVEGHVEGT